MRLPAGLLGVLRVGAVIALPGCDLVESAAAEVQALTAQEAEESEAEPVAEAESVEPAGDAWPQAEAAPAVEEAPAKIAAAPEGLGSDVRSALERARVEAPAEPAPLSEDPTVVVPFSEDPARVAPIRPREKTPEVRVRPRVRTRRVVEPVAVAPIIVVEPPRAHDWCPACGRG